MLLLGATGMVGSGVLRECLLDPEVETVLSVGRGPTGQRHAKLREIVHTDFLDYSPIAGDLSGYDACAFCLGITSAGMNEADYTRITFDMPMALARTLLPLNPSMTFIYVSGAGADSTERGPLMWARVKGRAENALLALPFRGVYVVRPGYIQPLHGIQSKMRLYRVVNAAMRPFYGALYAMSPRYVTTTERLGRAIVRIARHGAPAHVLGNADINALS